MPNLDLNLFNIQDQAARDNFQKLLDFVNSIPFAPSQVQMCEIYVTQNIQGGTIAHKLGGVPLDVITTRLIAPSAARLKLRYSDFTKDTVVYDVSGLSAGQTLSARFLVGTLPNVVTTGSVVRASVEVQEVRSKF